jgi:hypothetical protein
MFNDNFIDFIGSHTPQGRVTAMPQLVAHPATTSLPSVNNPAFFQQYFQSGAVQTSPSPLLQVSSGYSSAHLRYQEERQRWSTSAYKGSPASSGQIPLRAQTRNEVRVLLQVSYTALSGKVEKTVSL